MLHRYINPKKTNCEKNLDTTINLPFPLPYSMKSRFKAPSNRTKDKGSAFISKYKNAKKLNIKNEINERDNVTNWRLAKTSL